MCDLFGAEHTQSALEGASGVHYIINVSIQVKMHYQVKMFSSAPAGVFSRGKKVLCNVELSGSRVAGSGRFLFLKHVQMYKCVCRLLIAILLYCILYYYQTVLTCLVVWLHLNLRN